MVVRLQDVAVRAGVSVRTVSNVVNDFAHVAPATRERVQLALDELGYRPNLAARQLRTGRTGLVALVVPEIDSPYFSELAAYLVDEAEQHGLTLLVDQTRGDPARELRLLRGERAQHVDGVIVSPWGLDPTDPVVPSSVPVVLLGERSGHGTADHISIDNVTAAADATAHLIGLGRTEVAVIGHQPHLCNGTAAQRLAGYRLARERAGLGAGSEQVETVQSLHRVDGARAMTRLLDGPVVPDAVFCFTDELALGALRTCADRGVRVPDEIALVGFDDIEDGRYATPSLSTVSPAKAEIARAAMAALAGRLAGTGGPPRELTVEHRLLVRESSAC